LSITLIFSAFVVYCAKINALGCIADTKHRNSLTFYMAPFSQGLQRIVPTIIFCHHLHASGTAVHCVGLLGVGEGFHEVYLSCWKFIIFQMPS